MADDSSSSDPDAPGCTLGDQARRLREEAAEFERQSAKALADARRWRAEARRRAEAAELRIGRSVPR